MTTIPDNSSSLYHRRKELEDFDNTKLGVKGLVDSGITRIPRIFHHQPDTPSHAQQPHPDDFPIPIIDLSGPHPDLVDQVRDASARFGFFQVVNHGVPVSLLDRLVKAVKAFHELPPADKSGYYRRDIVTSDDGAGFNSNYDLYFSKAASWRDSLEVRLGPSPLNPDALPNVCREEVIEWDKEVKKVGEKLMGVLAEGLGVREDRLKGIEYIGRRGMAGHYYPCCPEPNKTMGIASHTDPGLLTVLLQDHIGGLQVKHQGQWLHLKPLHGALVVNIGDLFQMISNDEYKSGEHRVLANAANEPRVSVAVFFSPGINENEYGPLPELISPEKPALYRQFRFAELFSRFLTKELEGKCMTSYFQL